MFVDSVWHMAAPSKLYLLVLLFVYFSMDTSIKSYQPNYHLLETKACHLVFYDPRPTLSLSNTHYSTRHIFPVVP